MESNTKVGTYQIDQKSVENGNNYQMDNSLFQESSLMDSEENDKDNLLINYTMKG